MAGHQPTPPVADSELGDVLADLTTGTNIHPGIRLIASGIRMLGDDLTHTIGDTQLLLAQLAGSPDGGDTVGALALLIERLTNPDTNPCLRALPPEQAKQITHQGWLAGYGLKDPELRDPAAAANAHLDH